MLGLSKRVRAAHPSAPMASLIFDFPAPSSGRPSRVAYRNPVHIVRADRVGDVRPALVEVEGAVGRGLHAAGFLAYEAAPAFEPRMRVRPGNRLPLVWFGLFDGPAVSSPGRTPGGIAPGGAITPRGSGVPDADAPGRADIPGGGDIRNGAPIPDGSVIAGLRPSRWPLELDRSRYDAAVWAIREAIAAGLTYQVNLTARFRGELDGALAGDPVSLYEALRRAQGPGWHALLDLGEEVIVSVSPELFFRTRGRGIETRPMKGTRARGRWPEEDRALAAELAGSEKDRAENLMIVDLLRNDLGRICETGSVRVPRLFDVERYRTVWQMTSSVEGRLRGDVGLTDILASLFPCGSVTGAPKISTMELIAGLEASPREVYCGAMGVIRPDGEMAFNVPIRTLWWERATGRAEYGAGGGIVWDSTADAEYDELLAKAVVVRESWPDFELVETMAAVDGAILRLDRHLQRLGRSADYFGYPFAESDIRRSLADLAARTNLADGPRRVRLTLGSDGSFVVRDEALGLMGSETPDSAGTAPLPVALVRNPVHSTDRFLFHKTTHREVYESRRAPHPDAFDVLLSNEVGELTEFTRGNVVLELDGRRVTPPLAAGLLPGCFRAELLEAGVIHEAPIPLADLARATRVWFINSARRWLEVSLAPGDDAPQPVPRALSGEPTG
jgi:para-aminobenzoate synthetase / 4-amino-4-deoxychorismate lyase